MIAKEDLTGLAEIRGLFSEKAEALRATLLGQ
jgi:hypothetical protein